MAITTRRRALTALGAAFAGCTLPAAPATGDDTRTDTGVSTGPDSGPAGSTQRPPAPAQYPANRPQRPLTRAHAHNDYEHTRPLLDALDHRFGSVEADIYLVEGELLVAHDPVDLDPARTLESLYLDPLAARIRADGG